METHRIGHSYVAKTSPSRILLDTSFLMRMFDRPLKAFNRIEEMMGKTEFVVLSDVIDELRAIASSHAGRNQKISLSALRYVDRLIQERQVEPGLSVDEKIISYARSRGVAVATLDMKLRKELRRLGVTVITCRGGKVIVEGTNLPKGSLPNAPTTLHP